MSHEQPPPETFEDELDAHIAESMNDPAYRAATRGRFCYRLYRLKRRLLGADT